jgi:hypothetical protein
VTTTESKTVPPANDALALLALVIETVHVVAMPAQAPAQPVKVAPLPEVAVRVTLALTGSSAEHVVAPLPQLIPPPLTVPIPLTETVNETVGTGAVENVAPTLLASLINSVQLVAVPPQAPLQPRKVAPLAGVAVSTTVEF